MNAVAGHVDSLHAFVGRPASPPRVSPRPVDRSAIDNWCAALGDALPVYTDAVFAASSRWGEVIAPPTMLQTWTMPDRRTTPPPEPGPDETEAELHAELRARGYDGVVATDSEQTYDRPVRIGDTITSHTTIAAIAGPKQTAIGEGYFVTLESKYTDGAGEQVGTMLFRSFRHRAQERRTPAPPDAPELPRSPNVILCRSDGTRTEQARRAVDVTVGDALPGLEIPVTATLVIAGAVASGDFNVLHHDRDRARAAGAADIFLNILTTNGLVGRYVGEWAGPEARFTRVALRLGVPNHPYDTLRVSGAVERRDGATIVLRIDGTNSLGSCVRATVEVELP